MASLDEVFPEWGKYEPRVPEPKVLESYVIRNGRAENVYTLHEVYTHGDTNWDCMHHWEENVYDAIKNIDKVVHYNGKDAKSFFQTLKRERARDDIEAKKEEYRIYQEQIKRSEEYYKTHDAFTN